MHSEKIQTNQEGVITDHVWRLLGRNRKDLGRYRSELMGQEDSDDDQGDFIGGNKTETHHHYPEKVKRGLGTLGKVAGIAALTLGAGGIGAAIPLVLDYFSKPDVVDTDTDTSTILELILPPGE